MKRLHRFLFLVRFIDMVIEGIKTPQYSVTKRTFVIVFFWYMFGLHMFEGVSLELGLESADGASPQAANPRHQS